MRDAESLPSWCTRLARALTDADARATTLARGVTEEQLNWSPSAGRWSVGQCLEHLCVSNEAYLNAIAPSLSGRRVSPVDDIAPGWFGRWFIRRYIEPSPASTRARAPRKSVPSRRVALSVLDRFLDGNARARALIHAARRCDVNRIRFQNPFLPVIWFTTGTGFEVLVRHENRHLLQAERVRSAPAFPR